jgi:hypothetical protein
MFELRKALLLIIPLIALLLPACSVGSSSSDAGKDELSVCTKLKDAIDRTEEMAGEISYNPNASPTNLSLPWYGDDLQTAGLPEPYESNFAYADVLNFLAVAESCLSADAILYLNNYLEKPLIKAMREADGN